MLNELKSPDPELREAPRVVPIIRPAKLILTSGEYLCVLRDISETGISVRLFHDLPDERTMMVEFQCGDRHEIEIVWRRADAAGFRFSRACDLARLIAGAGKHPKRPVRLSLELPVVISTGDTRESATLVNLSTQGARVEYPRRPLAISELVHIDVPGLRSLRARVRWRRADTFGVVFLETFTLESLARYAAAVQIAAHRVEEPVAARNAIGRAAFGRAITRH